MGRKRKERSIRHEEQHKRHKQRRDDRQTGNLRQHERRVILGHVARPGNQRAELGTTVMARVMICTRMEIKRPDGRLLKFVEAGRANNPGHEANTDEQTGDQTDPDRGQIKPPSRMHGAKHVVHNINPRENKAATL